MKTMIKIKQINLLLVITLFITACVDTEKNKLDNRAEAYWQHKINKEFKEAYGFLSPGWKKTEPQFSYEQRMLISKANWVNSKLGKKQCSQPDLCVVTMQIEYEYKFKSSGSNKILVPSTVKETWIMKGNVWYHLPLDKKMSQK